MRVFVDQNNSLFDRKPVWWIGVLISAAIGTACFLVSANSIESEIRQRFASHALSAKHAIDMRLKSYTDVLRTAASMFQTVNVDARQFHEFADRLALEKNYPALETINFAMYVHGQDRAEFDRMAGTEAKVPIRPPGKRAEYLLISMVEPAAFWKHAVGIDILSGTTAIRLTGETRDSGLMAVSGQPIALMSGPNRTGLGMRIPVYRVGAPVSSVEERRAAFIGSIGIGFYVNKLVQGVLKEIPVSTVRMTVADAGLARAASGSMPATPELVLFDSEGSDRSPAPPLATGSGIFSITLPVIYHGRTWNVTFSTPRYAMYSAFNRWLPWIALAGGFTASLLACALLGSLLSARQRAIKLARGMTGALRESQARLQLSNQKLRALAAHSDQIKEGERKRIAREIHDDLGQNLLVLRIEAGMLASRTRERHPHLHARISKTVSQVDATIKSVRQIINDLRPDVLDLGLSAAVEWQVGEFRRRTGLDCEFHDDHEETSLDDYCATAFFRILQESLSNIVRHAEATKVWITLQRRDNFLVMSVRDNGVGLPAHGSSKAGSFGLVGIEERIALLGGKFSIASLPQGGAFMCVSVPVATQGPDRGWRAMHQVCTG